MYVCLHMIFVCIQVMHVLYVCITESMCAYTLCMCACTYVHSKLRTVLCTSDHNIIT